MNQLILTPEQTESLKSITDSVEVRDSDGNLIGVIAPFWSSEDIQAAQASLSSDQPRHTTEQVIAHLKSMESS